MNYFVNVVSGWTAQMVLDSVTNGGLDCWNSLMEAQANCEPGFATWLIEVQAFAAASPPAPANPATQATEGNV